MPAHDLSLLEEAAREAGEIARSFWREDPQVWDKGGDDPVSEADFAVDHHLRTRLLAARPDYGWVSEETEDHPSRLEKPRVFIVDPIDGTRSFVAGEKTWAHSLAVAENGRITAACVFLPVREKMYLAGYGQGATLNGAAVTATARDALDGATVLSPKVSFRPEHWKDAPPPVDRHFRPSLAYRLCLVAQGRYDLQQPRPPDGRRRRRGRATAQRPSPAPRLNFILPQIRNRNAHGASQHAGYFPRR